MEAKCNVRAILGTKISVCAYLLGSQSLPAAVGKSKDDYYGQ